MFIKSNHINVNTVNSADELINKIANEIEPTKGNNKVFTIHDNENKETKENNIF